MSLFKFSSVTGFFFPRPNLFPPNLAPSFCYISLYFFSKIGVASESTASSSSFTIVVVAVVVAHTVVIVVVVKSAFWSETFILIS